MHNVDSEAQLLLQPDADPSLSDDEDEGHTSSCSSDERGAYVRPSGRPDEPLAEVGLCPQ
jgi:hypothetical protein